MKKSFDLGNEFTKTFRPSHKRMRTQEVNGKKKEKEEVVEEKGKIKILITKKKLIKLVNSPAAAPKTWWAKPQVYGSAEVVKREYRSDRELFNLIYF